MSATNLQKNYMITTVLELLVNLKHHPGATKLKIKDADEQEFAIVDFISESNNALTIVIGEKVESGGDEEEG